MNLDEAQRKTVAGWIAEGANLAAIQKQLASQLGVNLTYMEVRLLVDDLKLTPKDAERSRTVDLGAGTAATPPPETAAGATGRPGQPAAPAGGVSVVVDQIARPGAIVSGKVTFSDGKTAEWYLDQMGRLGLAPAEKGYKPSAADVQVFQTQLQNELARMGF